ncbi:MAG: hypothetical protein ACI4MB_01830 [Candidatus Coproplasma sp.]
MKIKKFIKWLPGIISELIAIVFCVVYAAIDGSKFTMYLELLASALLPFAFPVYGLISKKPMPIILSIISSVFVFFASNLGSALGFYDLIYCWDLIMHGAFGFLCSLIIFVLIMQWNGDKLNPIGCLLIIFVFTLGVAALWEVWEYLADTITGGDAQRIEESIAMGKSPVADTMEDIMIAMAGSAIFLITLGLDKLNHYKLFSRLCGFSGFKRDLV